MFWKKRSARSQANDALARLLEELVQRWSLAGECPREGNTLEQIREFEGKNGLILPADVVRYFTTVNGMEDGLGDEPYIHFWPLGEVREARVELPDLDPVTHERYFVFADFLIHSHYYAMRLTGNQPFDVALVGGDRPESIAPTFTKFLEIYLRRPDALF